MLLFEESRALVLRCHRPLTPCAPSCALTTHVFRYEATAGGLRCWGQEDPRPEAKGCRYPRGPQDGHLHPLLCFLWCGEQYLPEEAHEQPQQLSLFPEVCEMKCLIRIPDNNMHILFFFFFSSQVTNYGYIPIFGAVVLYELKFTKLITKDQRDFPWWKFFTMVCSH